MLRLEPGDTAVFKCIFTVGDGEALPAEVDGYWTKVGLLY